MSKQYLSIDLDGSTIKGALIEAQSKKGEAPSLSLLGVYFSPLKPRDSFLVKNRKDQVDQEKTQTVYENYLVDELKSFKSRVKSKGYETLICLSDKRAKISFFDVPGNCSRISEELIHELGLENVRSINTGDVQEKNFTGYYHFSTSLLESGEDSNHFLYYSSARDTNYRDFHLFEKAGFQLSGAYFPDLAYYALYRWSEMPPGKQYIDSKPPYLQAVIGVNHSHSQVHLLYKDNILFSRHFDFGQKSVMGLSNEETTAALNKFFERVNISIDYMKRKYRHFQLDRFRYFGELSSFSGFVDKSAEFFQPREGCQLVNPLLNLEDRLIDRGDELDEAQVSSLSNAVGLVLLHEGDEKESANVAKAFLEERWQSKLNAIRPAVAIFICLLMAGIIFAVFHYMKLTQSSEVVRLNKKMRMKNVLLEALENEKKQLNHKTGKEQLVRLGIEQEHAKKRLNKKRLYDTFIRKLVKSMKGSTYPQVLDLWKSLDNSLPRNCFFEKIYISRSRMPIADLSSTDKNLPSVVLEKRDYFSGEYHISLVGYAKRKSHVMDLLSNFSKDANFSNVEIAALNPLNQREIKLQLRFLRKKLGMDFIRRGFPIRFIMYARVKSHKVSSVFSAKNSKKRGEI